MSITKRSEEENQPCIDLCLCPQPGPGDVDPTGVAASADDQTTAPPKPTMTEHDLREQGFQPPPSGDMKLGAYRDPFLRNLLGGRLTSIADVWGGLGGKDSKTKTLVAGPKDVTVSQARAKKHKFVAMLQKPYPNKYGAVFVHRYFSAPNYAEAALGLQHLTEWCANPASLTWDGKQPIRGPLCLNEILSGDVKVYADVEHYFLPPVDMPDDPKDRDEWFRALELSEIGKLEPCIQSVLTGTGENGLGLEPATISPLNFCWAGGTRLINDKGVTKVKLSLHFILCSKWRFRSPVIAGAFAAFLRKELLAAGHDVLAGEGVVDQGVYTPHREMRMVGSAKAPNMESHETADGKWTRRSHQTQAPLRRVLVRRPYDELRPIEDYVITATPPKGDTEHIPTPPSYVPPAKKKKQKQSSKKKDHPKTSAAARRDQVMEVNEGEGESDEDDGIDAGCWWETPRYSLQFLERVVDAIDARGPRERPRGEKGPALFTALQAIWNLTAVHDEETTVGRLLAARLGKRWVRTEVDKQTGWDGVASALGKFDSCGPAQPPKVPVLLGTLMSMIPDPYKRWMLTPERAGEMFSHDAVHFHASDLRGAVLPQTLANPTAEVPTETVGSDGAPTDVCTINDGVRSFLLGHEKTLAIKSAPGTAKTWLAVLLAEHGRMVPPAIQEMIGQSTASNAIPPEALVKPKRILYVTPRRTLTAEVWERLKSLGFVSYLKVKRDTHGSDHSSDPLSWHDRVIVCVKSLHRLRRWNAETEAWEVPSFEIVFLDELEVTLGFRASHLMISDRKNRLLCDAILRAAHRVVVLDADYGQRSHDFLHDLGLNPQVFVNDYVNKREFRFTDKLDLLRRAMRDVADGKRVFIACAGQNAVHNVTQAGQRLGNTATALTAMSGENLRLDSKRLKLKAGKSVLMVFNGVAQVGVSFEDRVDAIYILYSTKSAPPFAMWQLAWRGRNVQPNGPNGEVIIRVASADNYVEKPMKGAHVTMSDMESWNRNTKGETISTIEGRIRAHNDAHNANRDQDFVRTLANIFLDYGHEVTGLETADAAGWQMPTKAELYDVAKRKNQVDVAVASVLEQHNSKAAYLSQVETLTAKEVQEIRDSDLPTTARQEHAREAFSLRNELGLAHISGEMGLRVVNKFGSQHARNGLRRCEKYVLGAYNDPPKADRLDQVPEAHKMYNLLQLFEALNRNQKDTDLPHHIFDIGRKFPKLAMGRAADRMRDHCNKQYGGDAAAMWQQCGLGVDTALLQRAKKRRASSDPRSPEVVRLYKKVFGVFGFDFSAVDNSGEAHQIATVPVLATMELMYYRLLSLRSVVKNGKLDFQNHVWERFGFANKGFEVPSSYAGLFIGPAEEPHQTEPMNIFDAGEELEGNSDVAMEDITVSAMRNAKRPAFEPGPPDSPILNADRDVDCKRARITKADLSNMNGALPEQ
jgi:hypothetical protein